MGAAAAAAILRRREQEVVEEFRAVGAISPDRAQSYAAIGISDSLAIRRLRDRAVVREADPGAYYLDEEVWAAVRRTRQRLVIMMLSIVAVLASAALLGVVKW